MHGEYQAQEACHEHREWVSLFQLAVACLMCACLLKRRRCSTAACFGAFIKSSTGPTVAARYSHRAKDPAAAYAPHAGLYLSIEAPVCFVWWVRCKEKTSFRELTEESCKYVKLLIRRKHSAQLESVLMFLLLLYPIE